jgi:hypothetical protein
MLPAGVLSAPVPIAAVQPSVDAQVQPQHAHLATAPVPHLYDLDHWQHLVTRMTPEEIKAAALKKSNYRDTAKKAHPDHDWTSSQQADHHVEAQAAAHFANQHGRTSPNSVEHLRDHMNSPSNLNPLHAPENNEKGHAATALLRGKTPPPLSHAAAEHIHAHHPDAQHTAKKLDGVIGGHDVQHHVNALHAHAQQSLPHSGGSTSRSSSPTRHQPHRDAKDHTHPNGRR